MVWESTHPGGGGCQDELDIPLSPPDVLMDYNPRFPQYTERFKEKFVTTFGAARLQKKFHPHNEKPPSLQTTPTLDPSTDILPTQFRLAMIAEMIHTGSLLHDDVLDASAPTTRRFFRTSQIHDQTLHTRWAFHGVTRFCCSCSVAEPGSDANDE